MRLDIKQSNGVSLMILKYCNEQIHQVIFDRLANNAKIK